MKDIRRIENVFIYAAERVRNSRYGNPQWELHTSEGTYLTETDAALNYGIENYTNTRHRETFVIGDGVPAVTLLVASRSARVCYIELDGKVLH